MYATLRRYRRRISRLPHSVRKRGARATHQNTQEQVRSTTSYSTERSVESPEQSYKTASETTVEERNADLAFKRARSENDTLQAEQSTSKKRASRDGTPDIPADSSQVAEQHDDMSDFARFTTQSPYLAPVLQDGVSTVALFLNQRAYDDLQKALANGRRVAKLKKKVRDLESDIKEADGLIRIQRGQLEEEGISVERKLNLNEKIQKNEENKEKASVNKETLDPKLDFESGLLNFLRHTFLGHLQKAMIDAGAMEVPREDEDDESNGDDQEHQGKQNQHVQANEEQPEDEISIGEIRREEARERIINSRIALGDAQDAFEARDRDYRERFVWWHEAMINGATSETRSEFDLNDLLHCQKVTRDLIDAEEGYRAAKQHAKDVDSKGGWNSIDRESIFWNHPHDGYYSWEPEEGDGKSYHGASNTFIHRWVEDVVVMNDAVPKQGGDGQESGVQQPDPHVQEDIDSPSFKQARSLSFAVSIADIDQSWRRDKIDDWNAFCGRDR